MVETRARRRELLLTDIVVDADTQARDGEPSEEVVAEYAERASAGDEFPPLEVVSDGTTNWLWDGFHRFLAFERAGLDMAACNVREGTLEDARWLCCSANRKHALRRTNEDKRSAVRMALRLRPDSSDRAIAEHVGVGHPLVADVRARLEDSSSHTARRTGRDGRTTNTANIGKKGRKSPQGNGKTVTQAEGEAVLNGHADAAVSPPATEEENEAVRAAAPVLDAWGVPIQPHAAEAFEAAPRFGELAKLIRQAQKLFNEVANLPGGKFLTLPDVSSYRRGRKTEGGDHADRFVHPGLETALKQVLAAVPAHTVCPWNYADAPHPDDCPTCKGLNWTPELSRNVPPSVIERVKESFGVAEEVAVV